jgi:DNA-binding response OmpR family regulator
MDVGAGTEKKKGLEMGADAYVTKPFQAMELVAQMRSLLKT